MTQEETDMFRWLIAILLIIVGVVGIAGGIWGFSMQASSDVSPELVSAAQTVLEYADEAMSGVDNKIAEWTNDNFSLTGIMNNLIGGEVDLSDDNSVQLFAMVHALEVLLCGIIGVETGLLMIKFRRS